MFRTSNTTMRKEYICNRNRNHFLMISSHRIAHRHLDLLYSGAN